MDCSLARIPACMPAGGSEFAQRLCANSVMRLSNDLDSDNRAFQRHKRPTVVDIFAASCDTFFGTLFRSHGAIKIDLVPPLGSLREDTDVVWQDFNESPGN